MRYACIYIVEAVRRPVDVAVIIEDATANPLPAVPALPAYSHTVKNDNIAGTPDEMAAASPIFQAANITGKPRGDVWAEAAEFLAANGIAPETPGVACGYGAILESLPQWLRAYFEPRAIDAASVLVDWTADSLPSFGDIVGPPGPLNQAINNARNLVTALRAVY